MNPFSVLTSKIFGGLAVALLVFSVVQTWRIDGLKKENAQYELKLQTSNKSVELLESTVKELADSINTQKEVADTKTKAAQKALLEAQRKTAGLQSQISAIRAENLSSGGLCHTPSIILNTEGL
jgi:hypothetical protein